MQPEIGELFVGAYLRIIKGCPVVQYNAHDASPGGQGEVDVLGLNYQDRELYVCEVATHLDGAHYSRVEGGKTVDATTKVLAKKLDHARQFVAAEFAEYPNPTFMLWSPYVAVGDKTAKLTRMAQDWAGPGRLELWINDAYSQATRDLIDRAASETKQRGEVFYRALQLLTHLRGAGNKRTTLRLE